MRTDPRPGSLRSSVPGAPRGRRAAAPLAVAAALVFLGGCDGGLTGLLGIQTLDYQPYAAPAPYRPDDEFYHLQWHYELIDLPEAWAIMREAGSPGGPPRTPETVRVAVIDTGIRSHPDLDPATLVDEWDFYADDADATDFNYSATGFHGMHVAGTIAAGSGNGSWGAGVAGGSGFPVAEIIPLRALSSSGSTADIAQSVLYAAGLSNRSGTTPGRPARVLNLSLGAEPDVGLSAREDPTDELTPDDYSDFFLYQAISSAVDAGATVIAAAGNTEPDEAETLPVFIPALFDNTIAVSAVGPDKSRPAYSNTGPEIDFAGPGGNLAPSGEGAFVSGDDTTEAVSGGIWSTLDCPVQSGGFTGCIAAYQGTSMATPHVAGVAALLLSYAPELDQNAIYDILLATVEDLGAPGHDEEYGHGLMNARAALEYLINVTGDAAFAPSSSGDGAAGGVTTGGDGASGPMGRAPAQTTGALLPTSTATAGVHYDAGTVLLGLEAESLSPRELAAARERIAASHPEIAELTGVHARRLKATLAPGVDPRQAVSALAEDPELRFVQPNYLYRVFGR